MKAAARIGLGIAAVAFILACLAIGRMIHWRSRTFLVPPEPLGDFHLRASQGDLGSKEAQIFAAAPGIQVGLLAGDNASGAIWHGDTAHPMLVNSGDFSDAQLFAVEGSSVGGRATNTPYDVYPQPWHAVIWKRPDGPPIDLNPNGVYCSEITSMEGGRQAGIMRPTRVDGPHPVLWSGSASSMVDLLPAGFYSGKVSALYGRSQIGYAKQTPTGEPTAAMWNGSAGSYRSLHPRGFRASGLVATSGIDMVGWGRTEKVDPAAGKRYPNHALRWVGDQVVDLHPPQAHFSSACGTNGDVQIGTFAAPNEEPDVEHACLWRGTKQSFLNLETLLPKKYYSSAATAISGSTITGYAQETKTSPRVAIIWTLS